MSTHNALFLDRSALESQRSACRFCLGCLAFSPPIYTCTRAHVHAYRLISRQVGAGDPEERVPLLLGLPGLPALCIQLLERAEPAIMEAALQLLVCMTQSIARPPPQLSELLSLSRRISARLQVGNRPRCGDAWV